MMHFALMDKAVARLIDMLRKGALQADPSSGLISAPALASADFVVCEMIKEWELATMVARIARLIGPWVFLPGFGVESDGHQIHSGLSESRAGLTKFEILRVSTRLQGHQAEFRR